MKNSEVAEILYNIADILEMQDVAFKPSAYRKVARSIEALSEDINELAKKGKLKDIAGVGESIEKKLQELLTTGKLAYYDKLMKGLPKHILDLMEVPGLGPKKIKVLNEKLGIDSLKSLEAAAKAGKIRELEHFGEKSESEILKGLELIKGGRQRMLLGEALPTALEIEKKLKKLPEASAVSIAGSLRRRKETIGDIDILVASKKAPKVMAFFTKMPEVKRILAQGPTKSSVIIENGMQVDLRVIEKNFGAALQYFTGSKEHNVAVRDIAIKKGLKINEYGVFKRKGNRLVAGKTEQEVYKAIGMQCMAPELRENAGEIEAALKNKLPKIISYNEIKGDLHTHTNYTDGKNTIVEMVQAAKKLGYEYIAITDHSRSEPIAHGLDEDQLLFQIKEVKEADRKVKGIKVFTGSEVDIKGNGELDFPDEILKKLDIVVASIHSRFKSPKELMTKRITNALENEHVDIFGHPTGRMIYMREPYNVDLKKVYRSAIDNKVAMEINSQPKRMDLNDVHAKEAKEMGAKFVINTDAHTTSSLGFIQLGVSMARRGWLEKKDVLNTYPLKQLPKLFRKVRL
ncbi:DNA polymerase/3'-5' exonuclease PolX [Candidatus Woesearchaeota archaeon]|nr:DNA polymerase/3'-5' exonuclease PolX [Candidatus Woesearchaeota archaeon]